MVINHVLAAVVADGVDHAIGLLHVGTSVLVVGYKHHPVLPGAVVGPGDVALQLVHHRACLVLVSEDHASHSDVHLVIIIDAAAIVQHREVVVGGEGVFFGVTRLALPGEQLVVIEETRIGAYHAVVVAAAAKQQQVLQPVAVLALTAIIEHLAQPAIGHRVPGAA